MVPAATRLRNAAVSTFISIPHIFPCSRTARSLAIFILDTRALESRLLLLRDFVCFPYLPFSYALLCSTSKMASIQLDPTLLNNIKLKTVVVTGAAGGIGLEIVRLFESHGANVVMADLERARPAAEALIATLPDPSRVIFVPANTLDWAEMKEMFKTAIKTFGGVDTVIANAGVMESHVVLDVETVDANGELLEATEASKVIDINLKGTLSSKFLYLYLWCLLSFTGYISIETRFTPHEGQR